MAIASLTNQLSQDYLRQVFEYREGALYWKHDPHKDARWNSRLAGKRAGCRQPNGYDSIYLNPNMRNGLSKSRNFGVHRLVYCWHYGENPPQIDHINGDRADNRIENLRAALPYQNAANNGGYKHNTTGCPGVRKHRDGGYEARISFAGKRHRIGSFATL